MGNHGPYSDLLPSLALGRNDRKASCRYGGRVCPPYWTFNCARMKPALLRQKNIKTTNPKRQSLEIINNAL